MNERRCLFTVSTSTGVYPGELQCRYSDGHAGPHTFILIPDAEQRAPWDGLTRLWTEVQTLRQVIRNVDDALKAIAWITTADDTPDSVQMDSINDWATTAREHIGPLDQTSPQRRANGKSTKENSGD